jgi:dihydroorotase
MDAARLVALFSGNARRIFNLPLATITEGAEAELTLFNKELTTHLTSKDSKSKSANSPFWNKDLKGAIVGTFVKGKYYQNN